MRANANAQGARQRRPGLVWTPSDASSVTLLGYYDADSVTKDGSDLVSERTDLSGTAGHGIASGAARPLWLASAGPGGRSAISYDGTNQTLDYSGGLTSTVQSYTFGFGINPDTADVNESLFDTATGRLICSLNAASGQIGIYDGTWKGCGTAPTLVEQTLIFVFDSGAGQCRIYRDGVSIGTTTYVAKNIGGSQKMPSNGAGVPSFDGLEWRWMGAEGVISAGELAKLHTWLQG